MAKFDRVTTGTKRVIDSLDVLMKKSDIKLSGKNSQGQDLIRRCSSAVKETIVDSN